MNQMTMSASSPVTTSLVARARELVAGIAKGASERDANRELPHDLMQQVCAAGLPTARVPAAYGGPEASFVDLARIAFYLGKADPNLGQALQPHFFLLDWLRLDGTADQQERFFGLVTKGSIITNAIAEIGVKAVGETRTSLTRVGAGYRLDGEKFYSTGSLYASHLYITAKTPEDVLALVILPRDHPGIEILDDWDGMGQRTTASGTTRLTNVPVDERDVILLPDWGRKRTYLGPAAQLTHAAIDAGIAAAALEDGLLYARTKARPSTHSEVARASDDPFIIHAVGELAVEVHSAEAMLHRAAEILDAAAARQLGGEADGPDLQRAIAEASVAVAEAKAVANAASLRVSEGIYRVGGAAMTRRGLNFDRHWRNARTHTTHDPVAYKFKAVGDYFLNDRLPPVSTKI
jgi:SfnB family sulfur acquisition oxidoreductase